MKVEEFENKFCSWWHFGLAVFHFAAMKGTPTKLGKFGNFGAGVWHLDAWWNDRRGQDAYLKRGLRKIFKST